jgi:hypothetical protein
MVEEEMSGQRTAASAIPGLAFPAPQGSPYQQQPPNPYSNPGPSGGPQIGSPYSNPYSPPTNYYRQGPTGGSSSDITTAWVCAVIGLLCCGPVSIVGIVTANKARQNGDPNAQAPYIVNIVVTCIWVAGLCLYGIGIASLGMR